MPAPFSPGPPLPLSPELGRHYAVFVDTEEEFDWSAPFSRAATHTSATRALPNATHKLNALGIEPIYLCDYPVITQAQSAPVIQALLAEHRCWIGAHLHPWVTPPYAEDISRKNSFASNLDLATEAAKLDVLTGAIHQLTGHHPKIYRAGRYGIRPESFPLLTQRGYRLDVSIRPHFDYHAEGGPDFSSHPVHPWRTAAGIVCLPMTSTFIGHCRRFPSLYRARPLRGAAARTGLLLRIPLTPEGITLAQARAAIAALDDDGVSLFSLSFHSPSLVPGHTPYVRSRADLDLFWRWWEGIAETFDQRGIKPANGQVLLDLLTPDQIRR
ncbi:MAG: WalW protein [Chakrabartia sp.]